MDCTRRAMSSPGMSTIAEEPPETKYTGMGWDILTAKSSPVGKQSPRSTSRPSSYYSFSALPSSGVYRCTFHIKW